MARLKKSKIAKYGALAFAALLLCGIISIFASLLSTEDLAKEPLKAVALQEQTVTSLEIDVGGM